MNLHLSEQELLDCITVGPIEEQRSHLAACPVCAEELQRRGAGLASARSAVWGWAEQRLGSDVAFLKRLRDRERGGSRRRALQATAVVVVLLLIPATLVQQRRAERRTRQADEVLLRQVDQEISETVPDALQPLSILVVWRDEGKADESSGTQKTD